MPVCLSVCLSLSPRVTAEELYDYFTVSPCIL